MRWMMFLLLTALSLSAGEIAISFDDSPTGDSAAMSGNQRTALLLQEFKDHKIPQVMFFSRGITAKQEWGRQRLAQYAEAGHLITNHSFSHRWIRELGTEGYIADVTKAHETLKDLPGYAPYFRYPFLQQGRSVEERNQIWKAIEALGYKHGYVTVDNYEWYLNGLYVSAKRDGRSVDMDKLRAAYINLLWEGILHYDNLAQEALGRTVKHVLLLHENDLAALFIGDLVDFLRAQGWKIIPAEEAYTDPIAQMRPEKINMGQGRVASLHRAKGLKTRWAHVSESEVWLDEYVAKRGIFGAKEQP